MTGKSLSAFDAHDLKEEMRPPAIAEDDGWIRPESEWPDDLDDPLEPGMVPMPVLDPQHGEIRVLTERVVQVFTDEDIYHELVEWLDEVFEIPVDYDVYWVDIEPTDKRSNIEPHALIVLGVDDGTKVFWPEDDAPMLHHKYQRGAYSGEVAYAFVHGGGVCVELEHSTTNPLSPTQSAERADDAVRGADSVSGKNGWKWWSIIGTDIDLGDLRR